MALALYTHGASPATPWARSGWREAEDRRSSRRPASQIRARSSGMSSSTVRGWRGPIASVIAISRNVQTSQLVEKIGQADGDRRSTRSSRSSIAARAPHTRCGRRRAGRSETDSAPLPAGRTTRRTPSDAGSASTHREPIPRSAMPPPERAAAPQGESPTGPAALLTTGDIATPTKSAGTANTNPAIGPAMPMSNSIRLVGNRLANLDERAERAGQHDRHRDKEWQRRVDLIISAREIVPELVRAQNQQDGAAVPESVQQSAAGTPSVTAWRPKSERKAA